MKFDLVHVCWYVSLLTSITLCILNQRLINLNKRLLKMVNQLQGEKYGKDI